MRNYGFRNAVIIQGIEGTEDTVKRFEAYLYEKGASSVEVEVFDESAIIGFYIVNQHKIHLADLVTDGKTDIERMEHYFCPAGIFGYDVALIGVRYRGGEKEVYTSFFENFSEEAQRISEDLNAGYRFEEEENEKNIQEFDEFVKTLYHHQCLGIETEERREILHLKPEDSIEYLELSPRAIHVLLWNRMGTLGELVSHTREELLQLQHSNFEMLAEIEEKLSVEGYELKKQKNN